MPGIAGIVSSRPASECGSHARAMTQSMRHEPFHTTGQYDCAEMGIYAGWVAHEGSYAAVHSGMARDGVVAVVSGECVGDAGQTDLLQMYERFGDRFVERLNGLFSGLLIDTRCRRVLLFNDRYGLDRVCYHETGDALYFATEAKALLRVLPRLRAFDDRGVAQLLSFGCTQETQTLFRDVRLLEGGTLWAFDQGGGKRARYFLPEVWESADPLSVPEFDAAFQETFTRVLPRYLGGSSLGISLTGGLDTRMIVACLPAGLAATPVSYTFSARNRTMDERLAARIARTCGLAHSVLRVDDEFLAHYPAHVDRTVYATDGAFGATGAHEIYLNAKARQLASVRLTGNFGSEVFRNMSTFKPLGLSPNLVNADTAREIRSVLARAPDAGVHPVTFSVFREIPWNLQGSWTAAQSQLTVRTPYMDNDLVALAFRAPVGSRSSPEPALHLVERARAAVATIPTDRGVLLAERGPARLARRLVAETTFKLDYLHKQGLPGWLSGAEPLFDTLERAGILGLHQYLPYRLWFRRELAPHVADVLTDAATSRIPYWNRPMLESIARDHVRGTRNNVKEINAVLTLEAIDRLLLKGGA